VLCVLLYRRVRKTLKSFVLNCENQGIAEKASI
jgi:hypothetical protein